MTRLPRFCALLAAFCLSEASGSDFIKVGRQSGGWSFTQGDKSFLSMGVTTVIPVDPPPRNRADAGHYDGRAAHGGDVQAWAKRTAERLTAWGFNTLGGWSAKEMEARPSLYFTRVVGFGYGGTAGANRLIDVFSDEYAAAIEDVAGKEVAPLANEPRLLGWFTNNEMNWHGDFGWPTDPNASLFDKYLALPESAAGRIELGRWLRDYFAGDFTAFAAVFQTGAENWEALAKTKVAVPLRLHGAQRVKYSWAGAVAERWFSLCEAAIRRHDGRHLILGCRFAGSGMIEVLKAQARHCDVMTINRYDKNGDAPLEMFDELYALTGKPILIGEFGWRAMENRSGLKNTHGVDVTVPAQRDRAERLDRFVRALMARPYVVGMHWFQHHDEPTNGRFDGEDSNYGLVDQRDRPYEEVTGAFARLNAEINSASWKRDPFPEAKTRRGWPENETLVLAGGRLDAPVSLLPPAGAQGRTNAICDGTHGARLSMHADASGTWVCAFDNGSGWGTVPSFYPEGNAKLAGAKRLRVKLRAPAGTSWRILLSESGANDPAHHAGHGADGESFASGRFTAGGGEEERVLWLEDFEVRWEYGNQKGNRRLDLDGIEAVGVALPDAGRSGELRVLAFELLP